MESTRRYVVFLVLLGSILSNCAAKNTVQSIEIKNDTGDDLYMALVKAIGGMTSYELTSLYRDKDNVRVIGKDGLVKAGSSVTIKNFPWTSRKNYLHMLWGAKSAADLKAAIAAAEKNTYYENSDNYIKLISWIGNSSGLPGTVAMPTGDLAKVRIFKVADGEYKGQYTSEFIWPDAGKTA